MCKYIKKRWRGNLFAVIFLCLYVTCSFLETFILMKILDDIVAVTEWNNVLREMIIFAVILVLSVITYLIGSLCRAKVHAAMRGDIRCDLSSQLGTYSYEQYRERNVAEYIAWYSTNIEQISMQGFTSFYSICTTVFQTAIAVVSLGLIYWLMSIYSLLFIIVLYLISTYARECIIRKSREKVQSNEIFLKKIDDLLQGFTVLYCFKRMRLFQEKMGLASDEYEKKNYDYTAAQITINAFLMIVNIVFQVFFLITAIWFVFHNLIKASAIIGIYSFLPRVFDGLTDTIQLKNAIISAKPYFDLVEGNTNVVHRKAIDDDIMSIELKDLQYSYDKKQIFSNVNYRFEKGKKYALIGKSGCGKSTLLKVIAGLLTDYQGTMEINGCNALLYESILSQVAYIDQKPILLEGTIGENICLWNELDEDFMNSVLEESGLNDVNNIFENGLDTMICEDGKNLSGGQKQRIAIARALYAKKKLLFIDEGTSALDNETRKSIEGNLLRREDLTIIMISHHLTQDEQRQLDGVLYLH
ncbi:MAG: ABC transporter ATP-binding protein [Lachnospiraceae bacterium]|nr:ABC transporter ATP-binding protein [Lachnospiraceae bacterium]